MDFVSISLTEKRNRTHLLLGPGLVINTKCSNASPNQGEEK